MEIPVDAMYEDRCPNPKCKRLLGRRTWRTQNQLQYELYCKHCRRRFNVDLSAGLLVSGTVLTSATSRPSGP